MNVINIIYLPYKRKNKSDQQNWLIQHISTTQNNNGRYNYSLVFNVILQYTLWE